MSRIRKVSSLFVLTVSDITSLRGVSHGCVPHKRVYLTGGAPHERASHGRTSHGRVSLAAIKLGLGGVGKGVVPSQSQVGGLCHGL